MDWRIKKAMIYLGIAGFFITIAVQIGICAYFAGTIKTQVDSNKSAIITLSSGLIKAGEKLADHETRIKLLETEGHVI